MMRSSSIKQGGENNRVIRGHMFTLHQRLYHALNLGLRSYDDGGWKWQCTDIEIQRLVIRSIDAFLDCISSESYQHPLVKDSVPDVVKALEFTLHFKNESVLKLASKVALKIVTVIPNSVIESHFINLVQPLSALLSSNQLEVVITCAATLSLIISRLNAKKEREVWEILKDTKTVNKIIYNIWDFPNGMPIEFRREMISLLTKVLWRWPPSRFCVWNDDKLLQVLHSTSLESDFSMKVAILQLYSAIALCGDGAKRLLEYGETLLQLMVNCMDRSNPYSVRIEGFRLAGCFAISEHGLLRITKMCSENLFKALVCGLSNWNLDSGKLGKDHMSLLVEACRLAKITYWAGEHHHFMWKLGVESVLLNLLGNFHTAQLSEENCSSLDEQISVARNGLNANFLPLLRPYIWDILGGLATHCAEDLKIRMLRNELHLNILITCACLAFVDSLRTTRQICQTDNVATYGNASASKSVLLMIYSPCKYIASQAKCVLTEILKPNAKEDIKYLLNHLNATLVGDKNGRSNNLLTVVILISLACYSGLPQYWRHVTKNQGIKILSSFLKSWLRNPVHVKRSSVAPHLHNHLHEKTCCYDREEDWDGEDMLLLFCLWGLAELVRHSRLGKDNLDVTTSEIDTQLVNDLQDICIKSYASGPRCYAAYLLSYFELYGFPTKFGRRIGKAINVNEHASLTLILANQERVSAHGVIIKVRCPSLLPFDELPFDGSLHGKDVEMKDGSKAEVRLSAHVDHQALLKLLEYIYSGYLQAGEDLIKKLKIFAKHCDLPPLLQMLYRRNPKWGSPLPRFELTPALGPSGYYFSDITLEAKASEIPHWMCEFCSQPEPHLHAHKVILCLSCDYLQALFQSGMQESQSKAIKVDISWEALVKLINWFYSGDLPKPTFGCIWENLGAEKKLQEVEPYLELYSLTEYWLLEDLHGECSRVIVSCLDSARDLSIKIIKLAASYFQWDLAEIAANYMAPLYQHLRSSGELETLDEELVDMVRAASVRLSQEGSTSRI